MLTPTVIGAPLYKGTSADPLSCSSVCSLPALTVLRIESRKVIFDAFLFIFCKYLRWSQWKSCCSVARQLTPCCGRPRAKQLTSGFAANVSRLFEVSLIPVKKDTGCKVQANYSSLAFFCRRRILNTEIGRAHV